MLIGGLWHGAAWTFVIWGALHGLALVIHRIWKHFSFKINSYLAWFCTFAFINFSWIIFRAQDFETINKFFKAFCGENGFELSRFYSQSLRKITGMPSRGIIIILIVICLLSVLFLKNSSYFQAKSDNKFFFILQLICLVISLCFVVFINKSSEFLYFQF